MPELKKVYTSIVFDFDEICEILVDHARKNKYILEEIGEDFETEYTIAHKNSDIEFILKMN